MLTTRGYSIGLQHFSSEVLGYEAGLSFYHSQENEDMKQVKGLGVEPVAYDPKSALFALIIYQPTYGKILVGDYIQHFKLGFKAGLKSATEVSVEADEKSFNVIGLNLGVQGVFPIGERLSAHLDTQVFIHGKNKDVDDTEGLRRIWSFGLGIGFAL
jgi:hypothetical protein